MAEAVALFSARRARNGDGLLERFGLHELRRSALVTDAVQEPRLGIGDAGGSLLAVVAIAVIATGLAARRTAL